MFKYSYKAKDKKGQTIKGLVEAKTKKGAVTTLKEKELVVFSLKKIRESEAKKTAVRLFQRVSIGDLATFTRQLSTMITAGLPLPEALETLKGQSKPVLAIVIGDILRAIQEGGVSLAEALKLHQDVFGDVYVALVRAGETAGVLDEVMGRLADNLEKQKEFHSKIKGAMIYPVIIMGGMVLVATVMMIFVFPQLTDLFETFGADLPMATKVLMKVSRLMRSYWWMGGFLAVGLVFLWQFINRLEAGKRAVDTIKLNIPIFGNLQKQVALTEMVRTMALLVKTGISLVKVLNIIGGGMTNVLFKEGLLSAAAKVEKGFPLAEALADDKNFPPILVRMIAVGEETGTLDEVLFKVSGYFETESEHAIRGLTTAIEPLIMILLGIGVGFMVVSIIMPIYDLTAQF